MKSAIAAASAGHGQAAILGQEDSFRPLETLFDFGNSLDLFWSWHSLLRSVDNKTPRHHDKGLARSDLRWRESPIEPEGTDGLGPRYWSCELDSTGWGTLGNSGNTKGSTQPVDR